MRKYLPLLIILAAPSILRAQIGGGSMKVFAGVPTGACVSPQLAVNSTNGNVYSCNGGAWAIINGGGGAGSLVQAPSTTAANTIAPTANSVVSLTVLGTTGTGTDVFRLCSNDGSGGCGTKYFWFDSNYNLNGLFTTFNVGSDVSTTAAIVAAHGGNTTSLPGCFQGYNNSGTVNFNICANVVNGEASLQAGIATLDVVANHIDKPAGVTAHNATYIILSSDLRKILTYTGAGHTWTLPQSGAGAGTASQGAFGTGFSFDACTLTGSASPVTVTATTSTFYGAVATGTTSLTPAAGTCYHIIADGSNNYFTEAR